MSNPIAINSQEDLISHTSGKYILFACVGTDSTKYEIYEHLAKVLELKILIIDIPNCKLANKLQKDGLAQYIQLDMKSRSTLVDEAVASIKSFLVDHEIHLSGITTLWDDSVCLAARLCRAFGLPGADPISMDIAHDKGATRKFLENLGYAGPTSVVVDSEDDVKAAVSSLTFPAIMKPLYGAASIGVKKVDTAEVALEHYRDVLATLREIYQQGELMGLTFGDADDRVGRDDTSLTQVIFEEFIHGPEFDCDIALLGGEVVYCNLMDDWPFEKPHFIELGSSAPSSRPLHIQEDVIQFGQRVLKSMGFTTGVFHVEVIWSDRLGPCLVEVNPRMGGGPVRSIHQSVYGVDLAHLVVCAALDLMMKPTLSISGKTAVTINLFAKNSGRLTQSIKDCMTHLDGHPDVVSLITVGEKGDDLTGWFEGYPSALGRVNFMMEEKVDDAISRGKALVDTFYDEVEQHTIID